VDVHVRRLRAKLGADNEKLIGTVRNVGYRFVPGKSGPDAVATAAGLPSQAAVPIADLPVTAHAER
jgi:DNA-binding winged helix-turn-helix (wHTH) protein